MSCSSAIARALNRDASSSATVANAHAVLTMFCSPKHKEVIHRDADLASIANNKESECFSVATANDHAILATLYALKPPLNCMVALAKTSTTNVSARPAAANAHAVPAIPCMLKLPLRQLVAAANTEKSNTSDKHLVANTHATLVNLCASESHMCCLAMLAKMAKSITSDQSVVENTSAAFARLYALKFAL
eukprot:gnl/MRDRNA2_/MRDRNA2_68092_c0_seq3.p1 gnl/MRDRNA2_/MRDRNA2_68092_c0~~gnl/MRDRNA2_/MRDRNA2_68092_c0_seq3.p1  ORF type:complete len:191 (+),score=17.87 gnl/MRDRNA2_/MRDRNA2_68092_c0_seq3:75-647(+)